MAKNGRKISGVKILLTNAITVVLFVTSLPVKEEGWKQKPRQTVVVAFWGKMAAH